MNERARPTRNAADRERNLPNPTKRGTLGAAQTALWDWISCPDVILEQMPGAQDVLGQFSGYLRDWWTKDDWVSRVALGFVDANQGPDVSYDTSTACVATWGTSEDYLRAQNTTGVVTVNDSALAATAGDEAS